MAGYYADQIRAAFDANRKNLCAHGVRREHCADHAPAHAIPEPEQETSDA